MIAASEVTPRTMARRERRCIVKLNRKPAARKSADACRLFLLKALKGYTEPSCFRAANDPNQKFYDKRRLHRFHSPQFYGRAAEYHLLAQLWRE